MPASARIAPFLEFTPSASERQLLDIMSAETIPISHDRFAAALEHLSVGSLHLKAAEIRNSLAHLRSSNAQLEEFKDDPDCAEAVRENHGVMQRFEHRIDLLKAEVEKRGLPWVDEDPTTLADPAEPGEQRPPLANGSAGGPHANAATGPAGQASGSGSLGDEELARRLRERMAQDLGENGDDDDGVHL